MKSMPAPSDEQLVLRIREGDESSVHLLFDRHVRRLRGFVRTKMPALLNPKVAESDVIQESYLTAFRRLADFEDRGDGSFGRWLTKIVELKVREEVRAYLKSERRDVRRESADRDGAVEAGVEATPSAHAVARETQSEIERCLARLPADHQRVVRWIHDEGRALDDVARMLGRTPQATRKLYSRALARLDAELNR